MAAQHGQLACLLNNNFKADVARWLAEDCPSFDWGGFVVGDAHTEARLLGKSTGIIAGVPFFTEVFHQLGCTVEWHLDEGSRIEPVAHCATVRGPVRQILLGERVALNALARCSGIATKTATTLTLLRDATPSGKAPPRLAGTRKTTPGFRLAEKYAMLVGGADPHRFDLSACVMLKDNHLWALPLSQPSQRQNNSLKSPPTNTERASTTRSDKNAVRAPTVTAAVHAARAAAGFSIKIEVECGSLATAREAVAAGADIVMLDNLDADAVRTASLQLRKEFGDTSPRLSPSDPRTTSLDDARSMETVRRSFLIEVSGGLTEANLRAYADAGVDVISTSSIHQGVPHVDFSLKLVH